MTRPRLLVTGGGGQLGRELSLLAPEAFVFDRRQLDVTDREATRRAVAAYRPDVVVHAGAWTDVDGCELDPARAFAVNAMGTRWVVEAADRIGARVVLVSTDFVFDGTSTRPYTEWDDVGPLSEYGRSKAAAERELRPCDTVVRTAWLAGEFGPNIVRTVLRLAAADTPMRFVDDQFGNPSFCADVAPCLLAIVDAGVTGVVHAVNEGAVSWYEYVRSILRCAGRPVELVEAISTVELDPPRPAPRPPWSVLENTVLAGAGLAPMPHHLDGLSRLVARLTGDAHVVDVTTSRAPTGPAVR